MNTQKGVANVLLLLLGIAIIGGAAYFYTKKPMGDIGQQVTENPGHEADESRVSEEEKTDDSVAVKTNRTVISNFGSYEYFENNNWLIIRDHNTFEGERFGAVLTILDKKQNKVTQLSDITGFAYVTEDGVVENDNTYVNGLGDKGTVLISRYFGLHPASGPEMYEDGFKPDSAKLKIAEDKIGLELNDTDIKAYGGRPVAGVNAIFLADLNTFSEESLKVLGGRNGLQNTTRGIIFNDGEGNRWYNPFAKTFSRPNTDSYEMTNPKVSSELISGNGWKIVKSGDYSLSLEY